MSSGPAHIFLIKKLAFLTGKETAGQDFLDAELGSTGLDSLDLMEFFNEIEEAFDIRIDDDSLSAQTTVQQMIAFIEAKVASKPRVASPADLPVADKADPLQRHAPPH